MDIVLNEVEEISALANNTDDEILKELIAEYKHLIKEKQKVQREMYVFDQRDRIRNLNLQLTAEINVLKAQLAMKKKSDAPIKRHKIAKSDQ